MTLLFLSLSACTPVPVLVTDDTGDSTSHDADGPRDSSPPDDSGPASGDGGGDTETGDSSLPDGTDTGAPREVDCSDLPEEVLEVNEVLGARGFHDVAFDSDGWILGSDTSSIIKADIDGNSEIWVPGLGWLEQMDWLLDGDLVVARQQGSLTRISPEGGTETLATDVYAYEVNVAPDGFIWAANNSQILRIDPDSGVKERMQIGGIQGGPRLLAFSLDYAQLYVGVLSGGRLYRVELDDNLDPIGDAELFASGMGNSYMDGMALDVCGNIYVTEYSNSRMYRVSPDGEVALIWDPPLTQYGHGMQWGTGQDGWRDDAVYVPRPYGGSTVAEVVIGVPGRGWEGKLLNKP